MILPIKALVWVFVKIYKGAGEKKYALGVIKKTAAFGKILCNKSFLKK